MPSAVSLPTRNTHKPLLSAPNKPMQQIASREIDGILTVSVVRSRQLNTKPLGRSRTLYAATRSFRIQNAARRTRSGCRKSTNASQFITSQAVSDDDKSTPMQAFRGDDGLRI